MPRQVTREATHDIIYYVEKEIQHDFTYSDVSGW